MAGPFGGEERFGRPAEYLLVHAETGISYTDADILTWRKSCDLARSNLLAAGGDRHLPAGGHCVAGVHGKVQQCQFELVRVDAYGRQRPLSKSVAIWMAGPTERR